MGAFRVTDLTDEQLERQREYLLGMQEGDPHGVFTAMLQVVQCEQEFRADPTHDTEARRQHAWDRYRYVEASQHRYPSASRQPI